MRIIVNCTGGGSHSMMLLDHTTVMDLKKHVESKEGVPADQQLLLFAGQVLCPDTALLLEHLGLDRFSLAHEVVVYMQQQLAAPVLVYLCRLGEGSCQQQQPEVVESSSTLVNIMALLNQRRLASRPFQITAAQPTAQAAQDAAMLVGVKSAGISTNSSMHSNTRSGMGNSDSSDNSSSHAIASTSASSGAILPSCVVVTRQDGTCSSKVKVTEHCTVAQLQRTIHDNEGVAATHLSFYQAPDGCLHVVWGPSHDSSRDSYTVYSRSSIPSGVMLVKAINGTSCVPLSALIKEQAVMQ